MWENQSHFCQKDREITSLTVHNEQMIREIGEIKQDVKDTNSLIKDFMKEQKSEREKRSDKAEKTYAHKYIENVLIWIAIWMWWMVITWIVWFIWKAVPVLIK